MKSIFKIFIFISCINLSVYAYNDNSNYVTPETLEEEVSNAFSEGFNTAFNGLNSEEYIIQGLDEKEIKFKSYLVAIDTKGLDDSRRFALQSVGFKEVGSTPIRLKNRTWIVFDSFDRKANAVHFAKLITKKYFNGLDKNRQAFLYEVKNNDRFFKEKSFFSLIASEIRTQIKKDSKILIIEKDKELTNYTQREKVRKQTIEKLKLEFLQKELILKQQIKDKENENKELNLAINEKNKELEQRETDLLDVKQKNKELKETNKVDQIAQFDQEFLKQRKKKLKSQYTEFIDTKTEFILKDKVTPIFVLKESSVSKRLLTKNDFDLAGDIMNMGDTYISDNQMQIGDNTYLYVSNLRAWVIVSHVIKIN